MRKASIVVIESVNPDMPVGVSMMGYVQDLPKAGGKFFMYLDKVNPDNGKRYVFVNLVNSVKYIENELIIQSDEDLISLTLGYLDGSPCDEVVLSDFTPTSYLPTEL